MYIPRATFEWDAEWTPLELRGRIAALIVEERKIHGSGDERQFRVRFGRGVPGSNRSWYVATVNPTSHGSHIKALVNPNTGVWLTLVALPVFFGVGVITVAGVIAQRIAGTPMSNDLGVIGVGLGTSAFAALMYVGYRVVFWLDAEEMQEYPQTRLRRPVNFRRSAG